MKKIKLLFFNFFYLNGININITDDLGKTSLNYVCEKKLLNFCALLLEYGINLNTIDYEEKTVLHYSLEKGYM